MRMRPAGAASDREDEIVTAALSHYGRERALGLCAAGDRSFAQQAIRQPAERSLRRRG